MTPAQAAVEAFGSFDDNFNHAQATTARLRDGGMSAADVATALAAAVQEGLLAVSDVGSVSKPQRAAVESMRVDIAIGSLHDFELENCQLQRVRHEEDGKWFDIATGIALDKPPKHVNVVSLPRSSHGTG